MADRYVSRVDIAERLGVTERRITQLVKDGRLADGTAFPSRVEGRDRKFPTDRCFDWYIRFKQEEALQRAAPKAPDSLIDAELREKIADAEWKELRVAKLRGEVVEKALFRAELIRAAGLVRARLSAAPGEYAPRCVGLPDVPAAVLVLRDVVAAALAELQTLGVGEDDTDAPESDAEDAA